MSRSISPLDVVRTEFGDLAVRFYAAVLAIIAVVVAIPVFMVTGLCLVALSAVVGAEGGGAALLGIAWFIAFIGCTAVAVARIVQWLRPVTRVVQDLPELDQPPTAPTAPDAMSASPRTGPPPLMTGRTRGRGRRS